MPSDPLAPYKVNLWKPHHCARGANERLLIPQQVGRNKPLVTPVRGKGMERAFISTDGLLIVRLVDD